MCTSKEQVTSDTVSVWTLLVVACCIACTYKCKEMHTHVSYKSQEPVVSNHGEIA